jgi:DNA replication protein DnaC
LLSAALRRAEAIAEKAKEQRRQLEEFAAGQPQSVACSLHPHVIRKLNMDLSSAHSHQAHLAGKEGWVLVYDQCLECRRDQSTREKASWLERAGCPPILTHASFETFQVENEQDRNALAFCRNFAGDRKGFLVLTGALGDGKSFLAVAILRAIGSGKFITHNDMLFALRKGYGDPKAEDVLEQCQAASVLVLDDIGLSAGGRDDIPMLHHVLDHRHNFQMPTVLTSNLTLPEVYRSLGERMAQRMSQSLYKHIAFSGPSHRARMRADYLKQ